MPWILLLAWSSLAVMSVLVSSGHCCLLSLVVIVAVPLEVIVWSKLSADQSSKGTTQTTRCDARATNDSVVPFALPIVSSTYSIPTARVARWVPLQRLKSWYVNIFKSKKIDTYSKMMCTMWCLTKIFVSGSKIKSKKLQRTHHAHDEPYKPYDAVYGRMMTAFYGVDPYCSHTIHFFKKIPMVRVW